MKLPVKLVAAVRERRAPPSVTNTNLSLTLEPEPSALKKTGHFLNNSRDCFWHVTCKVRCCCFLINQFLLLFFFVHVNMKPESDFSAEDWPGSFIFAHTFFECGTARKLSNCLIITAQLSNNSVKLQGRRSVLSRSIHESISPALIQMKSCSHFPSWPARVIVGRTSVQLQPVQLPQVCRVPQHSLKGDTRRQAVTWGELKASTARATKMT